MAHPCLRVLPCSPIAGPVSGSDRKSTRLNSSHLVISYAVFCLKKKKLEYLPSQGPAECRPPRYDRNTSRVSNSVMALAVLSPSRPTSHRCWPAIPPRTYGSHNG